MVNNNKIHTYKQKYIKFDQKKTPLYLKKLCIIVEKDQKRLNNYWNSAMYHC